MTHKIITKEKLMDRAAVAAVERDAKNDAEARTKRGTAIDRIAAAATKEMAQYLSLAIDKDVWEIELADFRIGSNGFGQGEARAKIDGVDFVVKYVRPGGSSHFTSYQTEIHVVTPCWSFKHRETVDVNVDGKTEKRDVTLSRDCKHTVVHPRRIHTLADLYDVVQSVDDESDVPIMAALCEPCRKVADDGAMDSGASDESDKPEPKSITIAENTPEYALIHALREIAYNYSYGG